MNNSNWAKRILNIAACLVVLLVLVAGQALAADENPEKVNVNTATVEQLAKLPGVTPELAGAIVKYREEVGDYQGVDELLQVKECPRNCSRSSKMA